MALKLLLTLIIALVTGLFFLGLSRKMIARIQWRYGPPLIQPLIDIIKLLSQKSMTHGGLFNFGLVLSLAGSVILLLFIPLGEWCIMNKSGGLLVIIYLMLLAPFGTALSSGAAANPNASIGISRKLLMALAYEVPLLLILLTLMTYYNTISISGIIVKQQNAGWSLTILPLLLSGIAYILILPAVLGIRPFAIVKAPQEIASGPSVEYSGKFLAFAEIQHAFQTYITIALFVNLFLGGASNPGYFFLKMLVVFVAGILIHTVFPRFRIEQAIKYLWRWPALLALAGLAVVVILDKI
ncbi:MAG TPA: NADH-quinone oxidoreductase subunit H [Spirochaetota bacterium]|nr:NADH-quinone oxidoreductase subunit H [Spirochaetota bacterium]